MQSAKYFNPHLLVDRDTFIEQNISLAHKVTKKYRYLIYQKALMLEYDDILAHAVIGMIHAYDKFDPTKFLNAEGKAVKFSTYGVPKMIGEIHRMLRDLSVGAKFPRSYKEAYYKISRAELLDESAELIAKTLHMDIKAVKHGLEYRDYQHVAHLDAVMETDDGEITLIDRIGYSTDFDSENMLEEFLNDAFYSPRIFDVINLWRKGLNQAEIGKQLGISQAQVSRIQLRILNDAKEQNDWEMEEMAKEKLFVSRLKWLFENTNLNNTMITGLLDISIPTVTKYRKFYNDGQLTGESDPTISFSVDPANLIVRNKTKGLLAKNEERRQQEAKAKEINPEEIEDPKDSFVPRTFVIGKKAEIKKEEKKTDPIPEIKEDPIEEKVVDPIVDQEEDTSKVQDYSHAVNGGSYTSRTINYPTTVSLALDDADSFAIHDTFKYVLGRLDESKKYGISIQIVEVK